MEQRFRKTAGLEQPFDASGERQFGQEGPGLGDIDRVQPIEVMAASVWSRPFKS